MYIHKRRQTPCACRLRSCRFIPFSTYRMNTSTKASVWTYQSAYSVSTQMSSSKSLPAKTSDNRFWLIKSNVVLSPPKARQSMLYIWIICRPTNIITKPIYESERFFRKFPASLRKLTTIADRIRLNGNAVMMLMLWRFSLNLSISDINPIH